MLPRFNEAGAEEGDAGKAQVLMGHEHTHRHQVGLTVVVDEAADVAIEPGVNAVGLSALGKTEAADVPPLSQTAFVVPFLHRMGTHTVPP